MTTTKKIDRSDLTEGAKFEYQDGTIFNIDKIENGLVFSSFEINGKKEHFRDRIIMFIMSMNELAVNRIK